MILIMKFKTLIERFISEGYIANMMDDNTMRVGVKGSEYPDNPDIVVLEHLIFVTYENGEYQLRYGNANIAMTISLSTELKVMSFIKKKFPL